MKTQLTKERNSLKLFKAFERFEPINPIPTTPNIYLLSASPTGLVCSPWGQPFSARRPRPQRRDFRLYFHYTIFSTNLSMGKLHNLFPGTLCNLPIAFSVGLWYTIITVKGRAESLWECSYRSSRLSVRGQ